MPVKKIRAKWQTSLQGLHHTSKEVTNMGTNLDEVQPFYSIAGFKWMYSNRQERRR
jgi:hypothetical protein